KTDNYDPHITPAETAAREEREGENYKEFPDHEESLDTAGGYSMDREGLVDNFAIEPEMYINEPGDLREEEEANKARRAEELKEINEPGGHDKKGPGLV
ncbi:MAG TPA: hypothetical protein V6D06_07280, partial [Trichocoleus sp.]